MLKTNNCEKNGRLLATHSFTNSKYHTTLLKLQRNLVLILQLQGFALPCFSGQTFYKLPYYSTKTHNAPKLLKLSFSYLLKLRLSKFLPDFSHTILRPCDGKFDLLHFFKPMTSEPWCATVLLVWLVERSVEDRNFRRIRANKV